MRWPMLAKCFNAASASWYRSKTIASLSSSLKNTSYCRVPGSRVRTISMACSVRRFHSSSLPGWILTRAMPLISSIERPPVGSARYGRVLYDQIVADHGTAIGVVVRVAVDEPGHVLGREACGALAERGERGMEHLGRSARLIA